ncbi:DUF4030 domain-containing protein [Neobacillus drentensis]|uniref:DUF4030 domain-containing protein n=1 Tax=Neobacillus drentensis TaxID=220684 RepID=UPI00300158B4
MKNDLKEVKEYYNEMHFNDEIANRIKEGVHLQIHRKEQSSIGKKIIYGCGAAIAAFGLFIGLAFLSPTVANVAAKVPFLNMIFDSKPISEVITETLNKKGYKVDGVGAQYSSKKVFSVGLQGSAEYVKKVSPEVKKIVKDLLLTRDFDAYDVKVYSSEGRIVEPTPEEKRADEEFSKITEIVIGVLKSYGYKDIPPIGIDADHKTLDFSLPNTESKVDEIKQQVDSQLKANNYGTITVKVDVYNAKKRERENRWSPIISTIAEGTFGAKKYKVTGVGYTNRYAEYMEITISTSVSSSDSDYEEVVSDIKDTIQEFLTSKETKEIIKDDAYKVIITSKDKKETVIRSN